MGFTVGSKNEKLHEKQVLNKNITVLRKYIRVVPSWLELQYCTPKLIKLLIGKQTLKRLLT